MSEAPESADDRSKWLDRAGELREGEDLDVEGLQTWLRAQSSLAAPDAKLEVEQFRAGYSNLTYLLRFGPHELVLRRPPFGHQIKTGHDMHREFRVLSALAPVWPKAPSPVAYCDDEGVLGAPFYVMHRMQGIILRRQLPKGMRLSAGEARDLSTALVDGLAELHAIDFEAAGLGDLGHPQGYVRRQVEGWTRRYRRAQTDEHRGIETAAAWLADRLPSIEARPQGPALIHNDYKYDNVVLDPATPTRIIGVLDWEMATVGDPLMDFGTTLGYWVEPTDDPRAQMLAFGPTHIAGSLTRAQLVDRYRERSGREVEDPLFYYVFGLFKIAVIIQQIYARYKQGLTQDPRFAPLGAFVGLLGEVAQTRIDADSIS